MIDIWLTWCHLAGGACYYWQQRCHLACREHDTILLPGRRPRPIHFHACILHLKIIHTISSLQYLLGIRSSSATLLYNKGVLSVCIMVITRAGANMAAAKAVSTSREKEKRRKSAARTREWRKCQSEERRSEIRQSDLMGHAEVGGLVEKMWFFQIAPTPYLSILICSNMYQYDFLKVLLKKIPITYPLGTSNIELFLTNKIPHFSCNFSHICKHQITYIWGIISV